MATATFLILLSATIAIASPYPNVPSAIFNLTKGGLENGLRPLATTLSKTLDTFRGSLRSENGNGRTALNILGNTGGRFPYNVFGSAEGGGSLDFFGRIISNIQPYLAPLRIITSKSSGNATAMAWSTSEDER